MTFFNQEIPQSDYVTVKLSKDGYSMRRVLPRKSLVECDEVVEAVFEEFRLFLSLRCGLSYDYQGEDFNISLEPYDTKDFLRK